MATREKKTLSYAVEYVFKLTMFFSLKVHVVHMLSLLIQSTSLSGKILVPVLKQ